MLVVGSDEFFAMLPNQIRDGITVEVAANVDEAQYSVEVRPPNILIMQASVEGSLKFCRWLKQQTQLTWIYCILLEDRPQVIAERRRSSWDWEFSVTAAVLEESADAYVWLSQGEETEQVRPSARLLLAQIQVALRKLKKFHDLMQTNTQLSEIALADPLTQLHNRRALEQDLTQQVRASRTDKTPLSLIMLDVDYFKVVNDTYGHLVGDRILQVLCARLQHNMRFQDIPFRYGGEEFVILLPNTQCQEALAVARRINRLVNDQPFTIDNKLAIRVTISLGVACLQPSNDTEGVKLLDRADQYLLQAKAAGRNCTIGCEDK